MFLKSFKKVPTKKVKNDIGPLNVKVGFVGNSLSPLNMLQNQIATINWQITVMVGWG